MNLITVRIWSNIKNKSKDVDQRCPTGGPRATSGLRPLVTIPVTLFVNLLLVSTNSFIFFTLKDLKKIVVLILPAALRTSATHAIDFKNLP
jgi:hypothetical protein